MCLFLKKTRNMKPVPLPPSISTTTTGAMIHSLLCRATLCTCPSLVATCLQVCTRWSLAVVCCFESSSSVIRRMPQAMRPLGQSVASESLAAIPSILFNVCACPETHPCILGDGKGGPWILFSAIERGDGFDLQPLSLADEELLPNATAIMSRAAGY